MENSANQHYISDGTLKSIEIESVRMEEEDRHKRKGGVPYKDQLVSSNRVAKRVRHLTEDQIRKEYGIMQRPYKTLPENVIYCIWTKSPITVKELMMELKLEDKSRGRMTGLVSTIWKVLGDNGKGVLDRYLHGKQYVYKPLKDANNNLICTADQAIANWKSVPYHQKTERSSTIKKKRTPIGDIIPSVIEEAISNVLGLNVSVNGRIEIVFKLGG